MNCSEVIEKIHACPKGSEKKGLSNMQALLAQLGNPEKELQFVHIAGTNGKGSATAMTASVLQEAGYKVGRNISPYILDFKERFVINGTMISEEELAEVGSIVLAATEKVKEQTGFVPIEFEVVTAIALYWFAKEKCDIVCMEVGIGGRLDSTNVIQNTLVAYIMHMGIDHQNILGDTLAKITQEKTGILKNNCTVISYPGQPEEALQVIQTQAKEKECKLVVPNVADIIIDEITLSKTKIHYKNFSIKIPFGGAHQAFNATVVIEGCLALRDKGYSIKDEDIINGIRKTKFPARIEVISENPLIIVDGAHNEDGAKALANLLEFTNTKELTAVVGMVKDKDNKIVLRTISPYVKNIIFTEPPIYKALPAQQLAGIAGNLFENVRIEVDAHKAIEKTIANSQRILVTGSLYLAAEARATLLDILEEE